MNNLPIKLKELDNALRLQKDKPSFESAQKSINALINLIGLPLDSKWKMFSLAKIRSNAGWFMEAEGFADKRAAYKIADDNSKNIDVKAYWMKRTSKAIISWLVALTPNFEDEDFDLGDNVGIDLAIPKEADRIIVILSRRFVIRTIELHGELTVTQLDIFAKWLQEMDFDNKAQVHGVLWDSCDLEAVNKAFYKQISTFFTELKQHLLIKKKFDEKHAAFFTNRLLGRIVFCWFLVKKEIINPEMQYFDVLDQNSTDYYHQKLENLFFKVFNTPIENRESGIEIKTPFLNGGLFEIRENDKYQDSGLTFPEDYFDRLYAFLRHYNFTTDESTSSFQQVAIDPEMLGRIFENLLAEQVSETGEQARKAKGAFYTPREIVDYMCKESLREYLKTKISETDDRDQRLSQLLDSKEHEWRDQQRNYRDDIKPYKNEIIKALDEIKVIDPACGSGAFPMGMLALMLQCYERLEPRFDSYKSKLDIIKNNLFGVDIEPMAVEISRLRAWLSIIVDEDGNSKKIEPLPNLDFKFVCANSLIPLKREESLFDSVKKGDLNKLIELRDEYFGEKDITKKKKIKKEYVNILYAKKELQTGSDKYDKQLKSYHPFDSESGADFFDPEFMFGEKDFDVVIGNPPYVQIQKFSGKDIQKQYENVGYETFKKTGDLYGLFYERGLMLSKNNTGLLCYITSNKWMRAGYGDVLRDYFSKRNPLKLLDFGGYKVFEATVDTNILLIQNSKNQNQLQSVHFKNDYKSGGDLVKYFKDNKVVLSDLGSKIWFIGSQAELALKKKIEEKGVPLKDWDINIYRGIVTGYNEAFIIDGKKKDELIANDPKSAEIIKPILRGRDIKRYSVEFSDKWLIATFPSVKLNINDYPAIKEYLLAFGEKLEQTGKEYIDKDQKKRKSRKKTCNKWFETQDQINYYAEFEKEKIVYPNMTKYLPFFYDDKYFFTNQKCFIITGKNLKYLVGFLNSKISSNWIRENSPELQGGTRELSKIFFQEIPIKPITSQNSELVNKIEGFVDQIIEKKKESFKIDTSDLEKQIDQLVYELYGLTDDEIKIVEGKE